MHADYTSTAAVTNRHWRRIMAGAMIHLHFERHVHTRVVGPSVARPHQPRTQPLLQLLSSAGTPMRVRASIPSLRYLCHRTIFSLRAPNAEPGHAQVGQTAVSTPPPPCPQTPPPRPDPGSPRRRPRPPSCCRPPRRPPRPRRRPSADSGTTRRACAARRASPAPAGSGCRGRAP